MGRTNEDAVPQRGGIFHKMVPNDFWANCLLMGRLSMLVLAASWLSMDWGGMMGDAAKKAAADAYFASEGANPREVKIDDMDAPKHQLMDAAGHRFEEVETNIWGRMDEGASRRVLYLGTGKHAGGIILRALYFKLESGEWINASTGSPAPFPEERMAAW